MRDRESAPKNRWKYYHGPHQTRLQTKCKTRATRNPLNEMATPDVEHEITIAGNLPLSLWMSRSKRRGVRMTSEKVRAGWFRIIRRYSSHRTALFCLHPKRCTAARSTLIAKLNHLAWPTYVAARHLHAASTASTLMRHRGKATNPSDTRARRHSCSRWPLRAFLINFAIRFHDRIGIFPVANTTGAHPKAA